MISIEPREQNIVAITRGGAAKVAEQNTQHGQPQVFLEAQKKVSLNFHMEKEVFLDV